METSHTSKWYIRQKLDKRTSLLGSDKVLLPTCRHGHCIVWAEVNAPVNDDSAINVVYCDKCYENPEETLGDLRLIWSDNQPAFAAKEGE